MKVLSKVSIEKIFILFALIFGIIYTIITPPFQSVDESAHFLRSYAITQGQFISTKHNNKVGSLLPEALGTIISKYDYLIKDITQKTSFNDTKANFFIKNSPQKIFLSYPNTALYSPVPYIAQSTGIIIGKILNFSPLLLLYTARIFNLILYCILGYYAIKCTPYLKLAVFLILLSPMNISLAASCSTDVTLIGCSLLLFAKILQYTYREEKLSIKNYILLTLLITVIALTKQYVYFILFIFFIPAEKFGEKYIFKISTIILIPLILFAAWSNIISDLYAPLNNYSNLPKQIEFILSNPFKYIIILIISTVVKLFRLFITLIGVLGWQDTRLDNLSYVIYPVLIWITLIHSGIKDFFMNKRQKYLIVITCIFAYIMITTLIYLSWSKVGGNIIEGLNGKYYTPLLFPIFAVIASSIKTKKSHNYINNFVYLFTALILGSGAMSLLLRFYDIFPYLNYQI